jgi:predicted DNA-binding transcriptional regulator AlpA
MVMNIKAAAATAGVSVSLMNKMRVYGGGPLYVKIGRVVRYDESDVAAWLDGRKRSATCEAANDNAKPAVAA